MNNYNTNIDAITCSCLDWIESRQNFALNDPRRLCKHLINKLNINNLPHEIYKFKEDIEYYQKNGWGFRRDFDEVIKLGTFTLLGTFGWINVYDENAIKYGVIKETFSNEIFWANNNKPTNFSLIEKYLIKEAEKLPLPLEEEEHEIIINFIKKVLPQKKDYFIRIETSQFLPDDNGITYDIWESKLNPEQKEKLKKELLEKYGEDEAYYKLGEACSTPFGDEHEFCIYEALTVTNHQYIIKMYNGKKYKLERNYVYVKQLKESRELQERMEQEERERIWKEKLDKKIKTAREKNLILTEDYKGSIYRIQNFYNFLENSSLDELISIRAKALSNYDTLNNLIKENSINISTAKFNKTLVELGFITKESTLNLNNWILKNEGLNFGINYIKESPYMHEKIPEWYKTYIFNFESLQLEPFNFYENIKLTNILLKKEKFTDLNNIVSEYIKNSPKKQNTIKIKEPKLPSKKQLDREIWLRHVSCPKCGENTNIHKKDIRKRSEYSIQRFYCNECNSMFQIRVDELEKMIQENE